MDPARKLALIAVVIAAFFFLIMVSRLVYLLATRTELDLASIEMKSYAAVFAVVIAVALIFITVTGVVPTRHGRGIPFASSPLLFILKVGLMVGIGGLFAAVCVTAWSRKRWVVRIRR